MIFGGMIMSKAKGSDEQRRFWQMVFDTYETSGLSVRQFCKNEGLNESGFYYWRKKLAGDSATTSQSAEDESETEQKENPESSAGFIRVSLPKESSDIELVLSSGNVLKFSGGIDKQSLTRIISVLCDLKLC